MDPVERWWGGKGESGGRGFMDPGRVPVFGGPAVTEPALEALNIDFDIGAATSGGAQVPDINLDAGGAQVPDINLDAGAPSSAGSAPAGLDFDLGLGGGKPAGGAAIAAPAPPAAASAAQPPPRIGFDLPPGGKPPPTPAAAPPPAPPPPPAATHFL